MVILNDDKRAIWVYPWWSWKDWFLLPRVQLSFCQGVLCVYLAFLCFGLDFMWLWPTERVEVDEDVAERIEGLGREES
jgi:hypothetical protein